MHDCTMGVEFPKQLSVLMLQSQQSTCVRWPLRTGVLQPEQPLRSWTARRAPTLLTPSGSSRKPWLWPPYTILVCATAIATASCLVGRLCRVHMPAYLAICLPAGIRGHSRSCSSAATCASMQLPQPRSLLMGPMSQCCRALQWCTMHQVDTSKCTVSQTGCAAALLPESDPAGSQNLHTSSQPGHATARHIHYPGCTQESEQATPPDSQPHGRPAHARPASQQPGSPPDGADLQAAALHQQHDASMQLLLVSQHQLPSSHLRPPRMTQHGRLPSHQPEQPLMSQPHCWMASQLARCEPCQGADPAAAHFAGACAVTACVMAGPSNS